MSGVVMRLSPYAVDGGYDAYGAMEEDPEMGDYVSYEDYLARIAELEAKLATARADALKEAAKRNELTVRSIKDALDMRDWDAAREIAMKGPPAIRALIGKETS